MLLILKDWIKERLWLNLKIIFLWLLTTCYPSSARLKLWPRLGASRWYSIAIIAWLDHIPTTLLCPAHVKLLTNEVDQTPQQEIKPTAVLPRRGCINEYLKIYITSKGWRIERVSTPDSKFSYESIKQSSLYCELKCNSRGLSG